MQGRLVDDCFRQDPRDKARLSHDDVLERLQARVTTVVRSRAHAIAQASGMIAAEDVVAKRPVPGHTNAAVDGYAFAHASLVEGGVSELRLVARAAAGHPAEGTVGRGEAARIFTGAVLPEGCDTVVMQEDCSVATDNAACRGASSVTIPPGLRSGANVRAAGEDVSLGDVILRCGDSIRPQDIAALASIGLGAVNCFDRPKVAIVSTGDEVVRAGTAALRPGQVFDTNAPMLAALIAHAGCDVVDLGILRDDEDAVVGMIAEAAAGHDVILTSGGASQGEEDYIARAIDRLGARHFWQIAVKPGRPLMLGQIGNTVIVGLPGNPVAVFVCFLMYVYPLLRRLGGGHWPAPVRYPLPAGFSVADRKLGRREFWRGTLRQGEGGLLVEKFPRDGSGLITGLRAADGLIDIREDRRGIAPGDLVDFIPFSQFGICG